jgi:hypothetical protein
MSLNAEISFFAAAIFWESDMSRAHPHRSPNTVGGSTLSGEVKKIWPPFYGMGRACAGGVRLDGKHTRSGDSMWALTDGCPAKSANATRSSSFRVSLFFLVAATAHAELASSSHRTVAQLGFANGLRPLNLFPAQISGVGLPARSNRCAPPVGGVVMGRRRKGLGEQRSRWQRRDASMNPDEPQPENPDAAEGEVRSNKIAALVQRRQSGLILVMEDPYNVNNAGAVLRSCDAFGVTEAWFVQNGIKEGTSMRPEVEQKGAFEEDSNGLARMSSSASRWVKTRFFYSTSDALEQLKQEEYMNVATCFTANSKSMYNCDLTSDRIALWIGNEFAVQPCPPRDSSATHAAH